MIVWSVLLVLPNLIVAMNPLPIPLPSVVKVINIWLEMDVTEDGTEFPANEIINSSFSLPPLYIFK